MPTSTDTAVTPASRWRMSEIATLDRQTFIERLGFLFEGSPWIAAEAWDSRPWRTREGFTRRYSRWWRGRARSANSP